MGQNWGKIYENNKKGITTSFQVCKHSKTDQNIHHSLCKSSGFHEKNSNFLCPEVDIYMKILEQNKAEQKIGQM